MGRRLKKNLLVFMVVSTEGFFTLLLLVENMEILKFLIEDLKLHSDLKDSSGYHKIASLLISKGADLEAKSQLQTPLNRAAEIGSHEVVEVLLNKHADAGACPNIRSCCGLRPLEAAISVGATGMFERLLKAGADPNIKNNYGMTPLEVAALQKKHRIVKLLLRATSPIPTVREWSMHGITEHVWSEAVVQQRNLKAKEIYLLSKEKAEDAFERADYLEAAFWFSEASFADPSDAAVLSRRDLCWARLEDGISYHLDDGNTPHMQLKPVVVVV